MLITDTFNHFQNLAKTSKTLQRLIEIKTMDELDEECVFDKRYLQLAFTSLSDYYIAALDEDVITFETELAKGQFLWLLGLITDIALNGRLQDLSINDQEETKKIFKLIRGEKN